MSDISNQLPGILDTAGLRAKGGGGFKLFGIRLRSSGFSLSAAPNKVEEIKQNAKIAAEIVAAFDEKLKKLNDLGRQAEAAAKEAANAFNAAGEAYNRAGDSYNSAGEKYNAAARSVDDAAAKYNAALAEAEAEGADEGAVARFEAAKSAYEAADRDFAAAESAFKGAQGALKSAEGEYNQAKARHDAASADVKAVEAGIDQFQKAVPDVLADVGRQMGLEDVLVAENKRAADGKYTADKMSFTDQANTLLSSWAATMKDGVELDLRDAKGNLIKPEDDARLINPLTRERFKSLQIQGDKARITGEESLVVRNMGAISMFRKLFQQLMEELTAVATRRHS